jgi:LCP family protein required for cell wall assembly
MSFIKFVLHISILSVFLFGGNFLLQEYIMGENNEKYTLNNNLPKELQEIDNIEEIVDLNYFDKKSELENEDYFALLLLGVDDDNFKGSRTDSIIIAIINKENKKVDLLSIPRDFRVKLYNTDRYDKINSAFAIGGIDLTAATIEENFGIPIHYYSIINFNGFQDLVDALGGVNVNVEKDISFPDRITNTEFSLNKGEQSLSGIEALNYSRFRGDGEGDFGRVRRQQQVVGAIVNQTVSFRSIPKITKIYNAIKNNYESNVNFTDVSLLALKMRNIDSDDLRTIPFETTPSYKNGISYVESTDEEMENLQMILKKLLNGNPISSN